MQMIVLGTGDPDTENFFRWLTGFYRGRVGGLIGFSNELSHVIEAGSDFFLMPSLTSRRAYRVLHEIWDVLPIVRATGGLDDTVQL